MADLVSGIFENGKEFLNGIALRVMCVTSNSMKPISFTCLEISSLVFSQRNQEYIVYTLTCLRHG